MTQQSPTPPPDKQTEERPPLGSWRRMYAIVLGNLILLIVLFTIFTKLFD